jgi:hypothetical protein
VVLQFNIEEIVRKEVEDRSPKQGIWQRESAKEIAAGI